jgi:hypothetical protein
VVDAVGCALAWQAAVGEREAENHEEDRIRFRIGLNLGDVMVEGDDLYGDGVNIAARLEAEAEPGGISISGDAYRHAKGKIEAVFEDLGEQALKKVVSIVPGLARGGSRPFPAGLAALSSRHGHGWSEHHERGTRNVRFWICKRTNWMA